MQLTPETACDAVRRGLSKAEFARELGLNYDYVMAKTRKFGVDFPLPPLLVSKEQLLYAQRQGENQKEAAARLGVSPHAIHTACRRYNVKLRNLKSASIAEREALIEQGNRIRAGMAEREARVKAERAAPHLRKPQYVDACERIAPSGCDGPEGDARRASNFLRVGRIVVRKR